MLTHFQNAILAFSLSSWASAVFQIEAHCGEKLGCLQRGSKSQTVLESRLNSFSCGKVAMKQTFLTSLEARFKVFIFLFPEIESISFKQFALKSAYSRFTRSFRSTVCRKLPRRSRCVILTCRLIPCVEHRRLQTITSEVACVGILSTCSSVWCSASKQVASLTLPPVNFVSSEILQGYYILLSVGFIVWSGYLYFQIFATIMIININYQLLSHVNLKQDLEMKLYIKNLTLYQIQGCFSQLQNDHFSKLHSKLSAC
ncbi:Hypothetical_protein [Hexamita inflata]|uniref:Hypothetical_protein n=1 Tax=Hexamita inflata TaxID=28002 RepID=A0ABP1HME9_9EUKA